MYADDLVEWLLTIAQQSSSSCPVYNVGSDQAILIDELARKIGLYFKQDVLYSNFEYQFIDRYIPNIDNARYKLNLNLKFNLDDAITKTIQLFEIKN
jgi:nucleoside-diphosphate-sugar epimerase